MDRHLTKVLEHIGANVRRLRLEQNLTQEGLANEAEIDLTYLQRLERATVNVSVGVLVRVARALAVDVMALFTPAKMVLRKAGRPKQG